MRLEIDRTLKANTTNVLERAWARSARVVCGIAVCVAAAALSACATTKAAPVVNGPPLSVPEAPARVLVPPEEEPLVATGNGQDTPLVASPRVTPTPPPASRRTAPPARDTDTRTETPAVAATAVGPSAPEPPRELKPVPSATEPKIEGADVKGVLDKVEGLLRNVAASKTNTGNYKDARRFQAQAIEKLNQRNFVSASEAANKALQLATDLVGR